MCCTYLYLLFCGYGNMFSRQVFVTCQVIKYLPYYHSHSFGRGQFCFCFFARYVFCVIRIGPSNVTNVAPKVKNLSSNLCIIIDKTSIKIMLLREVCFNLILVSFSPWKSLKICCFAHRLSVGIFQSLISL